jgi:hypothetical protein
VSLKAVVTSYGGVEQLFALAVRCVSNLLGPVACVVDETPHLLERLIPLRNCVVARLTTKSFGFLGRGSAQTFGLLLSLSTKCRPRFVGRSQNRGDFVAQTIQHATRSLPSRVQCAHICGGDLGKIGPDFASVVAAVSG